MTLEQVGLDAAATYRLRLAVDEIATNIVTHGYAAARRSGALGVCASARPRSLTICIEDTGVANTPDLQPPDDLDTPPAEQRPRFVPGYAECRPPPL